MTLLETIRELKALGIDCYFEKEQMHSISPDGELLLTLLAMYAEEEARSASENQLWRIRKRFEQGKPWTVNMLGYTLKDGKVVIVPEEAEIVRQIYADYLSGMGKNAIANKLARSGVISRYAKRWVASGIDKILRNEAYIGNMLLQKTYRTDFRTKKTKNNHGEIRQYYVENSHEPIIDKATFEAARQERAKRIGLSRGRRPSSYEKADNIFAGMVFCGACGAHYVMKHQYCQKYETVVWLCNKYNRRGKSECPSQKIPESILIQKTMEVLETSTLTRELLVERLRRIIVPEHNRLTYLFKDGHSVDVLWAHPSRRLSWTPEMKEAARQRAFKRWRKEDK